MDGKTYVVNEGANKRVLKYVLRMSPSMDYNNESPYFGKYYDTYIDDIGNCWRSYDDGVSFIKEIGYRRDIV